MGTSRRKFLSTSTSIVLAGISGGLMQNPRIAKASGFSEYAIFDGLGLADLVRRKKIKPEELLEAAIAQIESLNPTLNAVVTKMYDKASETISMGLPEGPFTGVPFLLKDLGPTFAGVRHTSGSRLLANNLTNNDSEMVKRYKNAGLVTLGKLTLPNSD